MEKKFKKFNNKNIAPYLSKMMVLKNNKGDIIGKIPMNNMRPNYGNRLYRFAVMSDIHFYEDFPNPYNDENNALTDFERALNFINTHPNKEIDDISFSCVCGDIMCNAGADLDIIHKFKELRLKSKPIYTCTGNHDTSKEFDWEDIYHSELSKEWADCTGMSINRRDNFTKSISSNGKTIRDNFYFLSMRKFSLGTQGKMFKDEDIDDLENYLEKHKNQRTFIFTHCPFPMRAGIFSHRYNDGSYWLGGKWLKRLSDLSYKYKNTIWFSGHSHYQWDCQGYYSTYINGKGKDGDNTLTYNWKEFNYDANIWPVNLDHDRECGWSVHIPSCAGVRPISYGIIPMDQYNDINNEFEIMNLPELKTGDADWKVKSTSEFCIVDVYEDCVDIRGVTLIGQDEKNEGKLYYNPIAQYRLDTPLLPETTQSYSLNKISRKEILNMKDGESKNICITSVAYDNYHIGYNNNVQKYSSFGNSFINYSFGTSSKGNNVNCNLLTDNSSQKFIEHQNNEDQLFAEMRDLVNMRPKQFTFKLQKNSNGYYITNSVGTHISANSKDNYWSKDKTYFSIENNFTDRVATSSLVSQTNNDYLLRLKTQDGYLKISNRISTTNNSDGWTLLYIYEVIRA